MFSRAIVKKPCKNMVKGITSAKLGIPDYDLAIKQHKAYIDALEQCNLEVIILEDDNNFPDSTFVEDTCLITPHCAVITNPGAASRQNETIEIEKAVKEFFPAPEKIKNPGSLDAGDVMMVGNHYYIGMSDRTNIKGAEQLKKILKKYDMSVSFVQLENFLHLKTGVSYLEHNNLLVTGEFITSPLFSKFNLIRIDHDESYAANSVWINDIVITPAGFPKSKKSIKDAGYKTIEVDVSQFQKLDGGLSCLSLRF